MGKLHNLRNTFCWSTYL